MKIERINLLINPKQNIHKKYLYNEVLDLMNKAKVGGEFTNNHIKINGLPDTFLKFLKEAKIIFERVKKW